MEDTYCILTKKNTSSPYMFPIFLVNPYTQIVGSVKGLICFSTALCGANRVTKFILFNPSSGKFQSVPPPSMKNWDYKILLIVPDIAYFIYSLNANSWKRIATDPNTPESWSVKPFNAIVFVNGRFHWLACRWIYKTVFIRVFDVKTETFGQISLPESLGSSEHSVFRFTEFGESSVAVIEQPMNSMTQGIENHIWVMKEYGAVEAWIKLATLRLRNFSEVVLGFRNEDEVFIRLKSKSGCTIALQKVNGDEQVKKLMHVDNIAGLHICVQTYEPSLVLLDKQNDTDVAAPTL